MILASVIYPRLNGVKLVVLLPSVRYVFISALPVVAATTAAKPLPATTAAEHQASRCDLLHG